MCLSKKALSPIVFSDSRILILGTMPGEKSLLLQQYYGNKGNQFWKLLFTILEAPFSDDYTIRKNLLFQHKIALWDVLAACEREGSLDSKIRNEVANDFEAFHDKYPNIKHIFFSSKAAYMYYNKHVTKLPMVDYTILPSPSGANASKSFAGKLAEWQLISRVLR